MLSSDFWAGYLSGAVGILVGNPLDIIKVRLQAGNDASSVLGASTASERQPSVRTFASFRDALRGLPAPVITYGALNAFLFTTYNRSLASMKSAASPGTFEADVLPAQSSYGAHFMAGILAGLATFVISSPTELIKCRAQMAGSSGNQSGGSQSSWAIAKQTFRAHGLPGLYQGGVVTSVRDSVGYGFYFLAYELSKDIWDKASARFHKDSVTSRDDMQAAKILLCGGIAGVATWVSVFPLDVVKTRVQTQEYFAGGGPAQPTTSGQMVRMNEHDSLLSRQRKNSPRKLGAVAIAREAYRAEGVQVFFRGLTVCCLRAFIVNAVQWATYEYTMRLIA